MTVSELLSEKGQKSVTQLEMMPKLPDQRAENNPWPEWPRVCKTDYGQQEAIAVYGHDPRIYETTVKEFIKDKDGNVKGAKCVKLDWQKDEKTGRMNMVEIPDSEYVIDGEVVLIAAGFLGSQKYVADSFGVELNERTNVKTACPAEYATNVPKRYLLQAICTADSPLLSGQSGKGEKRLLQWMQCSLATQI